MVPWRMFYARRRGSRAEQTKVRRRPVPGVISFTRSSLSLLHAWEKEPVEKIVMLLYVCSCYSCSAEGRLALPRAVCADASFRDARPSEQNPTSTAGLVSSVPLSVPLGRTLCRLVFLRFSILGRCSDPHLPLNGGFGAATACGPLRLECWCFRCLTVPSIHQRGGLPPTFPLAGPGAAAHSALLRREIPVLAHSVFGSGASRRVEKERPHVTPRSPSEGSTPTGF